MGEDCHSKVFIPCSRTNSSNNKNSDTKHSTIRRKKDAVKEGTRDRKREKVNPYLKRRGPVALLWHRDRPERSAAAAITTVQRGIAIKMPYHNDSKN